MSARDVIIGTLALDDAWRHVPVGQLPGDPRPRAAESADAILAALDSAGLVIVPKELTQEILEAGIGAVGSVDAFDPNYATNVAAAVHRAMIAAKDRR